MHGGEFDTETSRIKMIIISNFEKRLQLPGFSPVRDIHVYLIAIVMLMFSSLNLQKSNQITVRVE